ncbi:MAG: hypothetical protein ACRCZF_06750, partial [Gemmataceae bacterium]
MRLTGVLVLGLMAGASGLPNSSAATPPPAPVGARVADFSRTEVRTQQAWSLAEASRTAKATVILFLGNGCPASRAYAPRLTELNKKYG